MAGDTYVCYSFNMVSLFALIISDLAFSINVFYWYVQVQWGVDLANFESSLPILEIPLNGGHFKYDFV